MKITVLCDQLGHLGPNDEYVFRDGRLDLDVTPAQLAELVRMIDLSPQYQFDILDRRGEPLFGLESAGRPRLPGPRGFAEPHGTKRATQLS